MKGIPASMGTPTGVVWNNPDDFEKARQAIKDGVSAEAAGVRRANPGNVSNDDFLGVRRGTQYGSLVTTGKRLAEGEELPTGAAPAPVISVPVREQLAQSPELQPMAGDVGSRVAAEPGKRVPTENVQQTLVAVTTFARQLNSPSETVKASAQQALSGLLDAEYVREGGPRKMVLDRLAKFGLTKES